MQLTAAELRCLVLTGMRYSDAEIGRELGRSVTTVSIRMRATVNKLGAKSKPHAVVLALKKGLIKLDELS